MHPSRQVAKLARAEGIPDLTPQFRATSITRGVTDSGLGVGITLPILDYGSRRGRIRQAEQSARAQTDRANAVRNQVRQEVAQTIARLRSAQTVVENFKQGTLDQAKRLLDGNRTALREGQPGVNILNVIEAQRTYRAVLTDYNNALVEYFSARAALERATGSVPATLLPQPRN